VESEVEFPSNGEKSRKNGKFGRNFSLKKQLPFCGGCGIIMKKESLCPN
jgi:hypothetical protein